MKCRGCGADYSARLLQCPYCGSVNEKAVLREKDKEERRKLLRKLRIRTIREAEPRIILQVLNRILFILLGIWVAAFGVICLVFYVEEKSREAGKSDITLQQHLENLESLESSGDYWEIGQYLSEYSLSMYEEGMDRYWQIYEIYKDMRDFWEAADETEKDPSGEETWRYEALAGALTDIWEYGNSSYEWDMIKEENEVLYQEWKNEAVLYLQVRFDMTQSETEEWMKTAGAGYENEKQLGYFLKERASENGR